MPSRPRPSLRALIPLLLLAVIAAAPSSACSQDNTADTSDPADPSGETDTADGFAGAEDTFSDQVARFSNAMESADDRCAVWSASLLVPVVPPSNADETRTAVAALLIQLDKMASTTDSTSIANLLRSSAVGIEAFAEEADYDPDRMDLAGDGPDTAATADYTQGLTLWHEEAAEECGTDTVGR